MAHHEIFIDRVVDQQHNQHAVPRGGIPPMVLGDTVQYLSSVGDLVRITFDEPDKANPPSSLHSPFLDATGNEKTVVSSTDGKIRVSNRGIFFCHCFLTAPGQHEIGWGPDSLQSGGNHEVK
jgi:hypothetical protein